MALYSPATAVTGDVIPAAFWNTNGRDILNHLLGVGSSPLIDSPIGIAQSGTPNPAAAPYQKLYPKTDGRFYTVPPGGIERPISNAPFVALPGHGLLTRGGAGWAEMPFRTIGGYDAYVLEYDAATDEGAHLVLPVPPTFTGLQITFTLWWRAAATTGAVVWDVATSNTAPPAAPFSPSVSRGTVTAAPSATANGLNRHTIVQTASLPSASDLYGLNVIRRGANASDTLAGTAELLAFGVQFGY